MVETVLVPKIGRIQVSTGKRLNPCEYRKTLKASTGKWSNLLIAEKWQNPGEYGEKVEFVRVSKNFEDEYRKRVESV